MRWLCPAVFKVESLTYLGMRGLGGHVRQMDATMIAPVPSMSTPVKMHEFPGSGFRGLGNHHHRLELRHTAQRGSLIYGY